MTLFGTGIELTFNTIMGTCVYGTPLETDLGRILGGETATAVINGVLHKVSGLCPSEVRWTGTYNIVEPKPLYIAPS